jgi:hypothetical protein
MTTKASTAKASTAKASTSKAKPARPVEVAETKIIKVGKFSFVIDADALDDLELLDMIEEFDAGNVLVFPKLLKHICGSDYAAVMNEMRDKATGRVTISAGREFFVRVMDELSPNS